METEGAIAQGSFTLIYGITVKPNAHVRGDVSKLLNPQFIRQNDVVSLLQRNDMKSPQPSRHDMKFQVLF